MSLLICKTTNWPNHSTSDHQDAKIQKYPILLKKLLHKLECDKLR